MGDEKRNPRPLNQAFLGILAVLLLVGAFVGSLNGLSDVVATAMIVAGLALAALAGFWSRIKGTVELGKDGAKIPVEAAERAERQLDQGRVVEASKVESAWKALEQTLSDYSVSQVGTPTITQGPPPSRPPESGPTRERHPRPLPGELETRSATPGTFGDGERAPRTDDVSPPSGKSAEEPSRKRRTVQLVDDAVLTAQTLTKEEQHKVQMEIARMSSPEFRPESDPKAIRRADSGRSYRVHRVTNTDLRLWYRPLKDDDPNSPLVVMVIEKKGEA